jgi:hypothetical protein
MNSLLAWLNGEPVLERELSKCGQTAEPGFRTSHSEARKAARTQSISKKLAGPAAAPGTTGENPDLDPE